MILNFLPGVEANNSSVLNFSLLQLSRNFLTDIKILHLNNTHDLLRNVAVSVR